MKPGRRSELADTNALLGILQSMPGTKFRAAELQGRSGVPEKYVRRRLTVDGSKALVPMPGVEMTDKAPFQFWWAGSQSTPQPIQPPAAVQDGSVSYESYYGLREKPFSLSADPRFLYRIGSHATVFDDLLTGVRRREGLVVLTGDIGTGKTTLCRAVIEHLDSKTFAAFVPDPFASREDLLKTLLIDFGVMSVEELRSLRLSGASRADLSYPLYEFLDSLVPLGAFAVLVIDEAQNLSPPLLEEIRILSDLERREKLLQVVLVGQLELQTKLKLPEMRQVDQRVSVRCKLEPLSWEVVEGYILKRLEVAGGGRVEFSLAAFDAVYRGSGGVPRLINLICDRALQYGCHRRTDRIDLEIVSRAVFDLDLSPPSGLPAEASAKAGVEERQPDPAPLGAEGREPDLTLEPRAARGVGAPQASGEERGEGPPRLNKEPRAAWGVGAPPFDHGSGRPEQRRGTQASGEERGEGPPRLNKEPREARGWFEKKTAAKGDLSAPIDLAALLAIPPSGPTGAKGLPAVARGAEAGQPSSPPESFEEESASAATAERKTSPREVGSGFSRTGRGRRTFPWRRSPAVAAALLAAVVGGVGAGLGYWLGQVTAATPVETAIGQPFIVQVGSFESSAWAGRVVTELRDAGYPAYRDTVDAGDGRRLESVRIRYGTLADAEAGVARIRQLPGYADASILPPSR